MGLELELKYAASPEVLHAVAQELGDFAPISMETTYFDTADYALSSKKMTLRRRFENGVSVCTLKTPAGGFARGEWDARADWSEETVRQLFDAAEIEPIAFDGLQIVCGARFTRLAKTVELPGCTVELALDEGILFGGGREIPLCELEVELKDGSQDMLLRWATVLAARYGLAPEKKSKFKRASALAAGE
ncbi:MAG: CYTH domain-containing protein [Ruminococcaceae bacterium]|nr:CYTH domain-containing protein [Oscillospiraceae bacterium]